MASNPINPIMVKYFYGRISRDEAENILNSRGCQEGMYLLRESISTAGNHALSICYKDKVHHYSIERQPDGMVMIQDGRKFIGPVELVQHHEKVLDGFLTKPTIPCDRLPDQQPMAWPGVTMLELELALYEKATSMKLTGAQLENALGTQRQQLVQYVARDLHKEQPWFHGKISREEADLVMNSTRHQDGKFLVRDRDDKSYALSLSHRSSTKHYKIEKHKSSSGDKLAIEDGPRFECLMDMIGHYHNKVDGLLCKLTCPCVRRGYKKKPPKGNLPGMHEKNRIYGLSVDGRIVPASDSEDSSRDQDSNDNDARSSRHTKLPEPPPRPTSRPSVPPVTFRQRLNEPEVRSRGIVNMDNVQAIWDDPDIPEEPPPLVPRRPGPELDDDPQKIYDSVPRNEEVFNLSKKDLEMIDRLGSGNFGSVMRGWFQRNGQAIPVAIKTLHIINAETEDHEAILSQAESELLKEARVMAGLQHRNIVRLIGVCRSDTIMLVMELAPLGQLNKHLKKHQEMPREVVLELMFQVAEGMAYLESKNFVHRDLAARNVLLVNEHFAKISDFGMSKALGLGNNYYQAETAGKWPLKWYAPECIYYFRFDSKSDVWSYGVTLWEALSYGAKPYKGLKGQQILELIEVGGRLPQPEKCPPGVYEIMLRCWTYDKKERPSFKELVEYLRKYK